MDHLSKCAGTVPGEGGAHHLHVKQEPDCDYDPEEKMNIPHIKAKVGQLLLQLSFCIFIFTEQEAQLYDVMFSVMTPFH